jgi:adenylate kinase
MGKVIITTAISGSGKDKVLEDFKQYATSRNKRIRIFHPGDMLFEQADKIGLRITPEKVLNTNPATISAIRSAVLESVAAEVQQLRKEDCLSIITMHAWFYWKYRYVSAFDHHYLERFKPDMYINFLDDVTAVEKELRSRKQWQQYLFGSDKSVTYGRERLLEWQSAEFETTKDWARRDRKPFFVIPSKASSHMMYRMIFEPWRKRFYLGMPLTLFHGDEHKEARERIDEFLTWLEKYVIIVDPRYVEPLSSEHLEVIDHPVYHQVVARDLYWLIPECDGMIALFPKVAFSAGVNNEMREVHETNGETILLYPSNKAASPFLTSWSDEIFRDEETFKKSFLNWLGSEYLGKVEASEQYKLGA